jgi:hypothetical protein
VENKVRKNSKLFESPELKVFDTFSSSFHWQNRNYFQTGIITWTGFVDSYHNQHDPQTPQMTRKQQLIIMFHNPLDLSKDDEMGDG